MELPTFLFFGALSGFLSLVLCCALVWGYLKIGRHHWNLTQYDRRLETHIDDYIDFRDKVRLWMKRDNMRQVRAAKNGKTEELEEASPTSSQAVKAHLRKRLAAAEELG